MIERLVPQASSFAGDIDGLIWLITLLVGFWFLVAEGVLFWLVFRFRAKKGEKAQYITGEKKEEMKWISRPHNLVLLCDIVIIAMAIKVWVHVKQTMPTADAKVNIISQQWAWTFEHAGPDGKLGTEDDLRTTDELHVEVGKTYHFNLVSRDVLHSFSVPVFRLKQDAVPGRVITGWFQPTKTGTFDIQCAEMCGVGHGLMGARIIIESPAAHAAWVAERSGERLARTGEAKP
ncbi:MAG: cytochrome c oxidase subunit II [Polyangiaceae bacterium]|nr:cytochrome c oxidase subunit II [Polyangiaceae bacterium]